jgi:hypothetical protein
MKPVEIVDAVASIPAARRAVWTESRLTTLSRLTIRPASGTGMCPISPALPKAPVMSRPFCTTPSPSPLPK